MAETAVAQGGASAPSDTPKVPQVVGLLTCGKGHALKGLYVLYRPKEEPKPDQATSEAKDLLKKALDRPFRLAMTNSNGWIGPIEILLERPLQVGVPAGAGVFAHVANTIPGDYLVTPQAEYEFYFIRHPSLELAKKIAAEINAGETKYGAPKVLAPEASGSVKVASSGNADDGDPAMFIPAGGDLYGKWVLYRDMPDLACEQVVKQVRRLQAHLGAMRYIVGNASWPYVFHAVSKESRAWDGDLAGGDNDGLFDVRTMNAVFSFQLDARGDGGRKPFQVDKVEGAYPHAALVKYTGAKDYAPVIDRGMRVAQESGQELTSVPNAWAYLQGDDYAEPLTSKPERADAVADASTASAVAEWLEHGLRKPGDILVQTVDSSRCRHWIRLEAAQAMYGWAELARALGFTQGIYANHIYRNALVDIDSAGYGRAVRSIHKSGYAIDIGMQAFQRGGQAWPVAYEQTKLTGKKAQWQMLALSTLEPCVAFDGIKTDQVLAAVRKAADAIPSPYAVELERFFPSDVKAQLKNAKARNEPPDVNLSDYVPPQLLEAAASAQRKLIQELALKQAFVGKYLRNTISPWMYDSKHPDGGVASPPIGPGKFFAGHRMFYLRMFEVPREEAKVKDKKAKLDDLQAKYDHETRAQAKKNLEGTLKRRQQEYDDEAKKLAKLYGELAGELAVYQVALANAPSPAGWKSFVNLTALAALVGLKTIGSFDGGWQQYLDKKTVADLPKLAEALKTSLAAFPKGKARVTRKKGFREWDLAELDLDFMAQWSGAAKDLKKAAPAAVVVTPPQVLITLSLNPSRDGEAEKLATELQKHANRWFYGELVEPPGTSIRKGSDWAQHLKALHDGLVAERKAREEAEKKRKEEAEQARKDSKLLRGPAAKSIQSQDQKPSGAPKQAQPAQAPLGRWMVSLTPVFRKNFMAWFQTGTDVDVPIMAGDSVEFPKEGQPIGQEWWHYQMTDLITARKWGELLEDVGWRKRVLLEGEDPEMYGREGVGYSADDLDRGAR